MGSNKQSMTDFIRVTDNFYVAPQITLEDVARAAQEGFTLLINNRPDFEAAGQPTYAEVEAAATAARLYCAHIPVIGAPTARQAEALHECLVANARVLAFCRSGTRSINTWAMGELMAGSRPKDEIIALGDAAGYDLRPVCG